MQSFSPVVVSPITKEQFVAFPVLATATATTAAASPPSIKSKENNLMSLCSWWAETHSEQKFLPHICHSYVSPEKLKTGALAPPMEYNFGGLASKMFNHQGGAKMIQDNVLVKTNQESLGDGAGRSIGLVGISLGVLFIILMVSIVSCMKRKKKNVERADSPVDAANDDDLRNNNNNVQQNILTIEYEISQKRLKDIPPDYNSVARMKELENLELPSYSEAVERQQTAS